MTVLLRVAALGLLASVSCASAPTTKVTALESVQRSSSKKPAVAIQPAGIAIHSTPATNRGRTLYMMVRALPPAQGATALESYEDASRMLFASERDPNVVFAEPVIPGMPLEAELHEGIDSTVILYFFFTHPGESWRLHIPPPLPERIFVDLGVDQVDRFEVKR
jgi:hypothetical protein